MMRAALLLLLLAGSLPAQQLVWQVQGTPNRTGVRKANGGSDMVAALGDMNGDGYDDVLQIAMSFVEQGQIVIFQSELWFLSGKDGKLLGTVPAPSRWWQWLAAASAGDMDGDKVADYAVTRRDVRNPCCRNNVVEVRSGRDHRVLWKVEGSFNSKFGQGLLGGLDLDGDRRPDLALTASRGLGSVWAYSNAGKLLWKVSGNQKLEIGSFGGNYGLGRIGDLDRDGRDDLVVGGIDRVAGRGAALVLSGALGKVLVKGLASRPAEPIGYSVDGCGDIDGDGVPDFAAGSTGFFAVGAVHVFSGRTGKVLLNLGTKVGRGFAGDVVRSGGNDFDLDGVPDVLVGTYGWIGSDQGAVFVFSGRDGSELLRLHCRAQNCGRTAFGGAADVFRPQPDSPFPRLVAVDPYYGSYRSKWLFPWYRGWVGMYRGAPEGVEAFGSACRGTLGKGPLIGIRNLGAAGMRLHLSNSAPASPAALLLGISRTSWSGIRLPLVLDPFGFPGCKLWTSVDVLLWTSTGSSGLATGYTSVDLPGKLSSTGPNTVYAQWAALGTGTLFPGATSGALRWRFR